jgi:serine-type D-Ala-D-Ala carboxypeptidase/endopeptidase
MKYLILVLLSLQSYANPQKNLLSINDNTLVYYTDLPPTKKNFPLLLVIEGSYVHEDGPRSIVRLLKDDGLLCSYKDLGIGVVLLERRGITPHLDKEKFHRFNTPSQRLTDHLILVEYLRNNPPKNWNGKLFVLGGSEGGAIAIKLSKLVNPCACITLVGCGDQSFKEYIWNHIEQFNRAVEINPWWKRAYLTILKIYENIPSTRDEYELLCQEMLSDPNPSKFWYGQTYLYWSDALEQNEQKDFLQLNCPALVVAGSKDIECESSDRLIAKAKSQNKNVTYLRIDGMTHDISDPQFKVMSKVQEYIKNQNFKITVEEILTNRRGGAETLVGLSIGVVDQGHCEIFNYGYSNLKSKKQVDADTIFEIGSITKVFTAILSVIKEQKQKTNLEDPIGKYLPKAIKVPEEIGKIRLIDLMTHTSRLPRTPDNIIDKDFKEDNPYKSYSWEKLSSFLESHELVGVSGDVFEYSNLGYGLLGRILEIQSGQSYETMLNEITIPLNMCDTRTNLTDEQRSRFSTCYDEHKNPVPAWDFESLSAAGSLRSTMNDMLKFAQANLKNNKGLVSAINKSHAIHSSSATKKKLALGWQVLETKDSQILWHNGGTGGSRSFIGLDKKNNRAIVVLSNTSNSIDDIGFSMLSSRSI